MENLIICLLCHSLKNIQVFSDMRKEANEEEQPVNEEGQCRPEARTNCQWVSSQTIAGIVRVLSTVFSHL
jgi:hypothetical protein